MKHQTKHGNTVSVRLDEDTVRMMRRLVGELRTDPDRLLTELVNREYAQRSGSFARAKTLTAA